MKSILGRHIVLFAVFRVKTKTILQLFQRRYIFLLINSFLKTSIRNFFYCLLVDENNVGLVLFLESSVKQIQPRYLLFPNRR